MTLSEKRQSVFPQEWCERVGLAHGGPVNVFDLGEAGLLIRPVKLPTRHELEAALAAARPRRSKRSEAERIVAAALRKVREADLTDLEKPLGVEIVTPRQFLRRLPRQVRRQLG